MNPYPFCTCIPYPYVPHLHQAETLEEHISKSIGANDPHNGRIALPALQEFVQIGPRIYDLQPAKLTQLHDRLLCTLTGALTYYKGPNMTQPIRIDWIARFRNNQIEQAGIISNPFLREAGGELNAIFIPALKKVILENYPDCPIG